MQAARSDYGDPGPCLKEVTKVAVPLSVTDLGWWAMPPSHLCLAGWLLTMNMKNQSKSCVGFISMRSHLLGGEPIGNQHGWSILINRAGLKH